MNLPAACGLRPAPEGHGPKTSGCLWKVKVLTTPLQGDMEQHIDPFSLLAITFEAGATSLKGVRDPGQCTGAFKEHP